MKIDDLIELLDNRLREFRLSRDYAKMSGNLERMNTADKEIIGLEDTLFQLNLLADTSKSAAVKEEILSEVITDGSVSVLGEYNINRYATDPLHERKVMNILSKMGVMDTVEKIDKYIRSKTWSSPVTGEMVMSASLAYDVDVRLIMAIMQQDSSFGTAGLAVRTLNPGNVGNDDDGNIRTYGSWQEGVTAVAEWLSRHRGSTIIPEEIIVEPVVPLTNSEQATSTPSIITPTATSTPVITTSTTTTITNLPTTSTSTPTTSTTTPVTSTTTPLELDEAGSTSNGAGTSTSTPATSTTTPETTSAEEPPTDTSTTATTTEETVSTSSPQTTTSTSTPQTTSTVSTSSPQVAN